MLRNFCCVLIISLFTTGIIKGQPDPVLTRGPENGHLIMAGDHLEGLSFIENVAIYDHSRWSAERDTTYQMPADSKEFYLLRRGQRYDMHTRTVIK